MSRENWQDFTTFIMIVWVFFTFFVLRRFQERDDWPEA